MKRASLIETTVVSFALLLGSSQDNLPHVTKDPFIVNPSYANQFWEASAICDLPNEPFQQNLTFDQNLRSLREHVKSLDTTGIAHPPPLVNDWGKIEPDPEKCEELLIAPYLP